MTTADLQSLDKGTIGRVAVIGAGIAAASFLVAWGGGLDAVAACKAAALTVGGWLLGHLQRTGETIPTLEGLKK